MFNTQINPVVIYNHLKQVGVYDMDFLFPDVTFDMGKDSDFEEWLLKMFDLWYDDVDANKPTIRYFYSIIRLFLGKKETGYEVLGRKINNTISLKPNGNIELVDSLKVCGNGFTHTGLNIFDNAFDDVVNNEIMKEYYYSHKDIVLCDKCKNCSIVDICDGGSLAHRYSSSNGFDNPSAYCEDIKSLVSHIQSRLFEDLPKVFNTDNVMKLS